MSWIAISASFEYRYKYLYSFSAVIASFLKTSESDVFKRRILTTTVDPRAVSVKQD